MVDFGSMGGGILGTVVMTRVDLGIRVEFRYSAYIVNTDEDPSNDDVETCTFVKILDLN